MELFVTWQRMKLKTNQETSAAVGGIMKKTGIISTFVASVFLIHLIWKIYFGADMQHFELLKDFVTLTTVFVVLPVKMIQNNKQMKAYILQHLCDCDIYFFILDLYSIIHFRIVRICRFKKNKLNNSISMMVVAKV